MPNLENLRAVTFHFHGQLMQRNRSIAAADTDPFTPCLPLIFYHGQALIARPSCLPCLFPTKQN